MCPLRLGREFALPEQWLRLAADAASAEAPLAVLLVQELAFGACSVAGIHRGQGEFGPITAGISATWSNPVGSNNYVDIAFSFHYLDENGESRSWRPMGATSQVASASTGGVALSSVATLIPLSTYHHTIRVEYAESLRPGPLLHLVIVHGLTEPRFAGDYGASVDKSISSFEGETPYAWQWLQEMRQVRGDAFSTAPGSFTEMENVALARHFGMVQRLAERHAANQLPESADQSLGRWAKILNIGTSHNRDFELRDIAAAKLALTIAGPTAAGITAAAERVFRHNFVQVHRFEGTIDWPPYPTFWPAGLFIGPGALDIGAGVWSSIRYHYLIELTAASDSERVRILGLVKQTFDDILISALTPVCTWSYSFSTPGGGFILGTSELGRDAL
jgi:hypothetical protein